MNNGDYEYRVAKIKSGQVGYLAIGDDSLAPMILLVGYSGNLLHWNKQFVENLAKHYRVYLFVVWQLMCLSLYSHYNLTQLTSLAGQWVV